MDNYSQFRDNTKSSNNLTDTTNKILLNNLTEITNNGKRKRLERNEKAVLKALKYLEIKLSNSNSKLNKKILKRAKNGYNYISLKILNYLFSPINKGCGPFYKIIYKYGFDCQCLLEQKLKEIYPGPPNSKFQIYLSKNFDIIIKW